MKEVLHYSYLIKNYIQKNYKNNFREPLEGILNHPFIAPGAKYSQQLWDWDSWLTGLALLDINDPEIEKYQKGCVLNYLETMDDEGRMPILIDKNTPNPFHFPKDYHSNIHKPCLAQHALEISKKYNDFGWLESYFDKFLKFIEYYENNQFDEESGLYFWLDDLAIGFDNDPTVFFRPDCSTGAIYLNSLMYSELLAISEIAKALKKEEIANDYFVKANNLKNSIQKECFDNVDGFFYSVDLSLKKVDSNSPIHKGQPRFWHSLPIKITTWAGMLPLYNKVATREQANRCVQRFLKFDSLNAKYGVRSIAKFEKMYGVYKTGNPSCWIGPVWINACYFTCIGLDNYGYHDLAKEIAEKVIIMLGKDLEKNKDFHEYYDPETGEGVHNLGFQSWNFLALKLIDKFIL